MGGVFGRISWQADDDPADCLGRMAEFLTHHPSYHFAFHREAGVEVGWVSPVRPLAPPVFRQPGSGRIFALDGVIYSLAEAGAAGVLPELAERFGQEGADTLGGLSGEFNLVVVDPARRQAWFIADRFGFRRLYLRFTPGGVFFAPEVKAILAVDGDAGRERDEEAIADYFNYGYPLGDRTFFRGIRLMPPASWIEFSPEGSRVRRYWEFHFGDGTPGPPFDEVVRRTEDLWRQAVGRRLADAERRPGCALSGGLDSRLIACTAGADRGELFTYTYGQPGCLDVRIAAQVARSLGLAHRVVEIDPACFGRWADRAAWLTEGMAYVPNALQLSTYPAVAGQFDVHLSGFAGDLTLGGSYIQAENLGRPADGVERTDNFLHRMVQFTSERTLDRLFRPEYAAFLRARRRASIGEELRRSSPPLWTLNQAREHFFIHQHCRRYINQISLQHYFSLDLKPFFDYELMDCLYALPEDYRLEHRLCFALFRDLYPEQAALPWQKTGGSCYRGPSAWTRLRRRLEHPALYYIGRLTRGRWNPTVRSEYEHYNQWYRRDRRQQERLAGVLLDPATERRGYFRREGLEALLGEQQAGGMVFYRLAAFYNIEMWHRLFTGIGPGGANPFQGGILS